MFQALLLPFLAGVQPPQTTPVPVVFQVGSCIRPRQGDGPNLQSRILDVSMDLEGRAWLLYQGRVWRRDPQGPAWREAKEFPLADAGLRDDESFKFREGTLYHREGRALKAWDPGQRRWKGVLAVPLDFQDFEVLEGSDLVLLGAPETLLQVHAPGNAHPLVRVPYPDLGFTESQADFTNWWDKVRSYTLAGRLVLYYPRCGRLFTYDALEGQLRSLDTPLGIPEPGNPAPAPGKGPHPEPHHHPWPGLHPVHPPGPP
ncbi:MAG TPA: hypothetical protein PKO12_01210, partial [Holophaga sp.]|nr:hypothetical protein [Holophaga sp.]